MSGISIFAEKKAKNEKITMLTCYDYATACVFNRSNIDAILIGDSLGMVYQGNSSTLPVTVDDIIYHARAVKRGATDKCIVADMPFMSYHVSAEDAVRNAGRIIKESGVDAVKIEGGIEILDAIKAIIAPKIPVMGHLGLTPQSINVFGGFKVQGKDLDSARNLIRDALALQDAGVFAFTFEGIPAKLMTLIQSKLSVPSIGIGAGVDSDGQVLVINDIIGMCDNMRPKFVKQYADVGSIILNAVNSYCDEVRAKTFPAAEHTFKINDEVIEALKNE
ncbi:MAG: 3-methyl-2-oxobutanoate hydroxymethyltransferase [Spirochaetales bacterium]|nr:3-methyl-2-oxobutanoate hydroxymethyltransferase [Spirochaetales bacterium]